MKGVIFQLGLLLVVLFGCLQLSQAVTDEEAEAMVTKMAEQCIKDVGVSADEAKLILSEEMDDMVVGKNVSDKMKCYLLCFYKKLGILDADGKPISAPFSMFMEERFEDNKDKIKPALAKCSGIKNANPCEAIYQFEVCMMKNVEGKE